MIRTALVLALLAAPAAAQDQAQAARNAARALEEASVQLDAAESARDQVRALTQTVQAYEEGLAALRDGLREAAIRETELSRRLAAQEGEISQLLGVLSALGTASGPQALLHPDGPVGSARAGMMLASVTPGLAQEAQQLRADLTEVTDLRALQENAAATLRDGLAGVQTARTELSQAVADRTALPKRFTEDPVRTAILIAATETLEGFASGLSEIATNETPADLPPVAARRGSLPLPVRGEILRRAGEADAAGVSRPGIVVATRSRALVTTPAAATVRYSGPLLDYGLVTILEPQPDLLLVLAGLDTTYAQTGEILPEGAPVGLMGGDEPGTGEDPSPSREASGAGRTETLYIEVREGDAPVDPLEWFASDKG
ncbi:murein hydrolase activator EnvC family protein [Salipiger marinus]|uniref:Septal ring factor EnvC, activator of murein hydrolases AmiA and AmiB n=1 Tax=Salipiger marinus TaxID=555512 RepID=A0A1G8S5K2_9RHOB|nr:peptidoglycan DD-metalloendopeptidase family protein [Salipiger marinus]SDJ24471.1 Septal ring factor EnvC, activator of murein hydrolases AmiA and AmiB [Salipiger marinus]